MDRISKAIEMANRKRKDVQAGRQMLAGLDLAAIKRLDVPKSVLEANKVVAGTLTNPVSEYYRMLRTKVLREMDKANLKIIGVTGPSTDAGKTLTATNLAVAIAMEPSHSCLLIDADLRKPAVNRLFGLTPKVGLAEFITGSATLDEVMVRPSFDKLGIIMNTQARFGSSDLLMGKTMLELLDRLRESEDGMVTVFDLPPVFVGDDAVALSSKLDGVLVVVDSGRTTKEQLASTLELLKDANVIGCVLNNAPDRECLALQYGYY